MRLSALIPAHSGNGGLRHFVVPSTGLDRKTFAIIISCSEEAQSPYTTTRLLIRADNQRDQRSACNNDCPFERASASVPTEAIWRIKCCDHANDNNLSKSNQGLFLHLFSESLHSSDTSDVFLKFSKCFNKVQKLNIKEPNQLANLHFIAKCTINAVGRGDELRLAKIIK